MNIKRLRTNRLNFLAAVLLVASVVFTACRPAPKPTGAMPNIEDLVATGKAGTQYAWTLGTIVSATQAAQAARTPAPPQPAPTAEATAPAAEDPCAGSAPGKLAYQNEPEGYCLFYPENFFVNKPLAGGVEFLGPALDQSSHPLRAYINITRQESVNGRTLDEIALNTWKGSSSVYHLSNIQLAGQDALVAENLQVGEASWKVKQVLFTHKGFIYLISLSPVDTTAPFDTALPDIQRFWDLAIPSFQLR